VSRGISLRAGELTTPVTFTRRAPGFDEVGEQSPDFVPLFDALCKVEPLSGREYMIAAEHAQIVDSKITLRYRPGCDLIASDRALVRGPQGGDYDIQSVLVPMQANNRMTLYARRINAGPEVDPRAQRSRPEI
jgi:SPP1 family predicted phage head-tail adaptor